MGKPDAVVSLLSKGENLSPWRRMPAAQTVLSRVAQRQLNARRFGK
jgi:hypothetical protein